MTTSSSQEMHNCWPMLWAPREAQGAGQTCSLQAWYQIKEPDRSADLRAVPAP